MDIEQAVRSHLLASEEVSSLIGEKVYPAEAEQGSVAPYVVYQVPSRNRIRALAGYVPLNSYSMPIDCYARTYAVAKALWAAVAAAMETLSGGEIGVQGVFETDTDGDVETPIAGEGAGLVRLGMVVSIWTERG